MANERPELSMKNKYYISKYRFYELKYYCMQYPTWAKAYMSLSTLDARSSDLIIFNKSLEHSDPTAKRVMAMKFYEDKMNLIKDVATETDEDMANYITQSVTYNRNYDWMVANMNIPCCRNTFYELRRRFFWLLNKYRD